MINAAEDAEKVYFLKLQCDLNVSGKSKVVYGRPFTKLTSWKDNDMLVKMIRCPVCFKKSYRQWLLVNRWGKGDMIKLIAGFCPSISICLLLKSKIIKVTGSVSNVFWILSTQSIPPFKGGTFISDAWCGGYHYCTISFNKGWTEVSAQCLWMTSAWNV